MTTAQMKILFLTDQVYLHGGLERVIANKVKAFSEYPNISTHISTVSQQNLPPVYNLDSQKVSFHDLDITYDKKRSYFTLKNLKQFPRHLYRIKKVINTVKPDVIVLCNYTIDFYFLPFIKGNSLLIKEYHSSRYEYDKKRRGNTNFFRRLFYRSTDYFEKKYSYLALLNQDEKKFYRPQNLMVIPNFIPEQSKKIAKLDRKTAIAAGRLAPVKGFDELILIWKDVSQLAPEWKLEIYGDGDEQYIAHLKNIINDLNLRNSIYLMGPTDNLKDKMLQSSVYLMTSLTECFPMVLLEALDLGLPIISYDIPTGPRNIIRDSIDGYLVPNKNKQVFTEKMLHIINNIKLRKELGSNAKERAKKFFSDNIVPKWLELYKNG